jgi:SAM-dependent methyltransferase
MTIYASALDALLREGALSPNDSVLVVCGGAFDRDAFLARAFANVTISNLALHRDSSCDPYPWRRLDAEDLAVPDQSYDWAVVHMGLHHCASPHRGLNEMMRVARKGVLVMENRDSLTIRLAVKVGLTRDYEIEPVALDPNHASGGWRNGGIPNFVYRWTEWEVTKTAESARPGEVNDFRFFYGLRLPTYRIAMSPRPVQLIAKAGFVVVRGIFKLFPKQGNEFAFAIIRTGKPKPWMKGTPDALRFNTEYRLGFDPEKYHDKAA